MAVFVVIPDILNAPGLTAQISAKIPAGDFVKLPNGEWLVAFNGTSRELSDALGISDGATSGGGVVLAITSSYWGRATKDVWEWIQKKNL